MKAAALVTEDTEWFSVMGKMPCRVKRKGGTVHAICVIRRILQALMVVSGSRKPSDVGHIYKRVVCKTVYCPFEVWDKQGINACIQAALNGNA